MSDRAAAGRVAPDVRFYLPAPPLRPLVTSYYIVDAPGPLDDFTHPEWGNIRFVLQRRRAVRRSAGARDGGAARMRSIFGPTDRTRRFDSTGGLTLGVG